MAETKFLSALGLCKRAGKLSEGNDAVDEAIKSKKARLIIIGSDASPSHKKNVGILAPGIETIFPEAGSSDFYRALGKKICILSVNDRDLVKLVKSSLNEGDNL